MKACLRIALAFVVFNSLALPSAVQADDQTVTRQTRVRTTGPTPHLRVVCYDRYGHYIACANSARVALQLAYEGTCDGCEPYRLPQSRYGAGQYRYWWPW